MEIKKVQASDFRTIAKENEYYLWSFLQKEQVNGDLTIWSLFDSKIGLKHKKENKLIDFLKIFPITFYESYVDESMDFLTGLGLRHDVLYKVPTDYRERVKSKSNVFYQPVVLLFNKFKMIDSTLNHCYCVEGIVEMILEGAPSLSNNFKID